MIKTFAALILAATSAIAAPDYYWDFNGSTEEPSIGDAFAFATSNGTGGNGFGVGTTVGALPDVPAGESLSFFDLGGTFYEVDFVMLEMNFTGTGGADVTFALQTNRVFALGETIRIYVSTGGPGYSPISSQPLKSVGEWNTYSFTLPELANVSSGGILLRADAIFDVAEYVRFDNIAITKIAAVPEPATSAYAALALIATCIVIYRSKKIGGCKSPGSERR